MVLLFLDFEAPGANEIGTPLMMVLGIFSGAFIRPSWFSSHVNGSREYLGGDLFLNHTSGCM